MYAIKHLFIASCLLPLAIFAQTDYTKLVNPFIGTGGHGHTYPGASMPFGMMQLSPDTRMADWDGSSGYHYSDSVIYGFSHTHLSGTGIPDYCDLLLMPFVGEVKWNNKDYHSPFSHQHEKASPGYYEVMLDKGGINVQLTTSVRSGMHQYTFPPDAKDGSILIDLQHRDEVLDAFIEKVSDHEIRGYRRSKSWAQNQVVYFDIQFEKSIREFTINNNGKETFWAKGDTGKNIKAFVRFNLSAGKIVKCKVSISGVSMDGAALNLNTEVKDWDFEKVKANARQAWNTELGKIDIKGGTHDQQTVFYTALYHTFLVPNIYKDVDSYYRGTDKMVHQAEGFDNYTMFSLWDTHRAYHPLMTIINQKRTKDWIATFLKQYQYGGMLPVWELSANETFCMVGYHSVPVIWDAGQKGLITGAAHDLLIAMTSYAESNRFGLDAYRKYGYIPNNEEHESVSKTLDYAYDDWCIAQMAKAIGNDSIYKKYIERAQYYKNVFDPSTKKMRGKVGAMWHSPFDPKEINNFYTEGNSWQYSFSAPQDITGLINLYGGKEEFTEALNGLFQTSSQTTGREQADVTGLIGQYAQGNEPSHHIAYLFNYVGHPGRMQELVHRICTAFYTNAPDGLIGNEDCGQMSAWYILSAMGFYPVTPGSGLYALGTPLFDEVKMNLENGKMFVIKSKRLNADAYYVASTTMNGKPSTNAFLLHSDVMKGGELDFTLSHSPSKSWGTKESDIPHSQISDAAIVPAPYFDVRSNKFKDSITVKVKSSDIKATVIVEETDSVVKTVMPTDSIKVYETKTLQAFAVKGSRQSKMIYQTFYKLPSDKAITVLSGVNTMYTGGGNDALIDGITGGTNWQSGDWQSYYDKDFEAIIDLQTSRAVSYVGLHVLQDVSPWILYPKEVIFYTSHDGKTYTELNHIQNKDEQKMDGPHTKEMGVTVGVTARYIKVKAINGGKLPAWHESAGQGSHLFIDEVIVK